MINKYMSMELLMETTIMGIEIQVSDINNSVIICESADDNKVNLVQKIKDLIKSIIDKLKAMCEKGLEFIITKVNANADDKIINFAKTANVADIFASKKNTTMESHHILNSVGVNSILKDYYKIVNMISHKFDLHAMSDADKNFTVVESTADEIYNKLLSDSFHHESEQDLLADIKSRSIIDKGKTEYSETLISNMISTMLRSKDDSQDIISTYGKISKDMQVNIQGIEALCAVDKIGMNSQKIPTLTNVLAKYNSVMGKILSLMTKISIIYLNAFRQISTEYYAKLHGKITSVDVRKI
jgi:hypothetical protein